MLIVQGSFRVDPAQRDAFVAQNEESMRMSRGEKGCLEYVFAPDPLEPDRVILSERWESQADLDEHLAAAGRRREAAGTSAPAGVAPLSAEITVYEIASSRRLR